MPKSNVLDTRSGPKEQEYKRNVLLPALRQNAKGDYADLLDNYNVKITADKMITGGAASIDATKGVIYLDPEFAYGENTALLATLIKHEILHSLLNHLHRGFNKIADELGINPKNVSRADWERIYKVDRKLNYAFNPAYGGVRTNNIAADLDLARLYTPEEVETLSVIGGLIRDEYPEYEGLSYEEMRTAINKEEKRLKWRLAKKFHGSYNDETGEFTVDREEPNEFDSNVINPEDLRSVMLPKWRWQEFIQQKYSSWTFTDMWFMDKNPEDDAECIGGIRGNKPIYAAVTDYRRIIPVILVRNLNRYNIKSGLVKPGNLDAHFYVIPNTNYIISMDYIGDSQFNDSITKYNDYKGSDIQKFLENWLASIKR